MWILITHRGICITSQLNHQCWVSSHLHCAAFFRLTASSPPCILFVTRCSHTNLDRIWRLVFPVAPFGTVNQHFHGEDIFDSTQTVILIIRAHDILLHFVCWQHHCHPQSKSIIAYRCFCSCHPPHRPRVVTNLSLIITLAAFMRNDICVIMTLYLAFRIYVFLFSPFSRHI